jgi:hypothetical protein
MVKIFFDIKDDIKIKDTFRTKDNVITLEMNSNKSMLYLFNPYHKICDQKQFHTMRNINLALIII